MRHLFNEGIMSCKPLVWLKLLQFLSKLFYHRLIILYKLEKYNSKGTLVYL